MNNLDTLLTKKANKPLFSKPNDIVLFKGDGNYTWVYLANGSKKLICKTMHALLSEYHQMYFVRTHKSYSVNINHILRHDKFGDFTLLMTNGLKAEVSRRKKKEVLSKLDYYN